MRRARLREYTPWMLRDYMKNQGPSTAVVVLLVAFLSWLPLMQALGSQLHMGNVPLDVAVRTMRAIVAPLVVLGALFATNGIVAHDRKFGFYRFLFAKPVTPPTYYAITFAVYGVGLLIVTLVLLGVWALTIRPMFPLEVLGVVAIMYIAYGGIGFLLSATWRFDWLSLVTVLVVANVLRTVWATAEGLRHWLLFLLPPVHRADDVYSMVVRSDSATIRWSSPLWLAGYGLACFALGLIVLRRRSLGSS